MPLPDKKPHPFVYMRTVEHSNDERRTALEISSLAVLLQAIQGMSQPFWIESPEGNVISIEQATTYFGQTLSLKDILQNDERFYKKNIVQDDSFPFLYRLLPHKRVDVAAAATQCGEELLENEVA